MLSPATKPDLPGARLRFDRFELDEAEARLTCAGEAASGAMQILPASELERLVRQTFPEKPGFSAEAELGIGPQRQPIVTFVHGGADPFLDRPFEDWLTRGAGVRGCAPVAQPALPRRCTRAGGVRDHPGHRDRFWRGCEIASAMHERLERHGARAHRHGPSVPITRSSTCSSPASYAPREAFCPARLRGGRSPGRRESTPVMQVATERLGGSGYGETVLIAAPVRTASPSASSSTAPPR